MKVYTVGNSAKLREALIKAITMLAVCEWPDGTNMEGVEELRRDIDAALAAPPRNCDVGTLAKQEDRFEKFCDAHKYVGDDGANWCSRDCPCYNSKDCGIAWAQMPYEEGNEK